MLTHNLHILRRYHLIARVATLRTVNAIIIVIIGIIVIITIHVVLGCRDAEAAERRMGLIVFVKGLPPPTRQRNQARSIRKRVHSLGNVTAPYLSED
jgi:hypothetical protein